MPKILAHPGHLPPFWDKSVTFFCNLHSMFFGNQEQMARMEDHIRRLGAYGGRVVPILNLLFRQRPNLLVIEDTLDPVMLHFFEERLGLSLPELAVLPSDVYQLFHSFDDFRAMNLHRDALERIQTHPSTTLDGFVTDEILEALAAQLSKDSLCSWEASHLGNNKLRLHQLQVELGLPHFDTEVADTPAEVPACLARLRAKGYARAVVKAQVGASGLGMVVLPTDQAPPTPLPAYFFFEGACLVQGWMDGANGHGRVVSSPSVQMFLEDDAIHLYEITTQILDEHSVWEGNMAPEPGQRADPPRRDELLRQSGLVAEWLHGIGYRGTASADFVLFEQEGAVEVIVCEINARLTGATYPTVFARHFLPEGAWRIENLRFDPPAAAKTVLDFLEQNDCLYLPGKPMGALPLSLNLNMHGNVDVGQLLCLGPDLAHCQRILERARQVLPIKPHG